LRPQRLVQAELDPNRGQLLAGDAWPGEHGSRVAAQTDEEEDEGEQAEQGQRQSYDQAHGEVQGGGSGGPSPARRGAAPRSGRHLVRGSTHAVTTISSTRTKLSPASGTSAMRGAAV